MSVFELVSVLISTVALLVSFSTWLKTFRLTAYPAPKFWLALHEKSQADSVATPCLTYLAVGMKNLDSAKSMPDTKVWIKVGNPLRRWRLWQPRWFLYYCGNGPDLDPLERDDDATNSAEAVPIETFLVEHCPGFMLWRTQEETSATAREHSFGFKEPKTLELMLTVEYGPGTVGTRSREVSKLYRLVPDYTDSYASRELHAGVEAPYKLWSWDILEGGIPRGQQLPRWVVYFMNPLGTLRWFIYPRWWQLRHYLRQRQVRRMEARRGKLPLHPQVFRPDSDAQLDEED